jgi:hypothetical protein
VTFVDAGCVTLLLFARHQNVFLKKSRESVLTTNAFCVASLVDVSSYVVSIAGDSGSSGFEYQKSLGSG